MKLSRISHSLAALLCAFGLGMAHAGTITADHDIWIDDAVLSAVPGATLDYEIVITNLGPGDATNSTVTTVLDAALTCTWTCVASAGSSCTAAGAGNVADTIDLLATATATYLVSCDIDASATGTLSSTASIAVDAGVTDPNTSNDFDLDDNTVLAPEADLAVTKTGPTTAIAGGQATYTIEVTNTGPSDADSVVVEELPPVGFTFASATGPCGAGFPCNVGNLAASGSVSFDVTFDIDPSVTGSVNNTASVFSNTGDPNGANDSDVASTTVNAEADLAVTKTGPATAVAGGQATYTIEVTSAGPSDATNVSVIDTPPAGLTFASATAPCAGGFPCNLGTLADTDVVSFNVTFDIDPAATGTLDNTASVSSDATDPNAANDSDVASTTIGAEADLSITKTDNETLIQPGDSVTYTIVASNAGPSAAPDATITDVFQLPLTNCSWTSVAAGGATGNGSGSGDINEVVDMPPGSSVTYTATCGTLITSGPVTNTATISSASVTDPNGANDAGVDGDTFLDEIRAIPTLSFGGLLLLLGLIATIAVVRIRASA